MERYKKQKPKMDYKSGDFVRESERYSKCTFIISGINRAGKRAVKYLDEKLNSDKNPERSVANAAK